MRLWLCRQIAAIVEGEAVNLVESLAEKIAMRLLMGHEQMNAVEIRVTKPHVALGGPLTSVGMAPHLLLLQCILLSWLAASHCFHF